MEKVIHRAATRGRIDRGWLRSRLSFCFSGYYDPERVSFGALRVLNDHLLAPGEGFGSHPHADMEIVTIVLAGSLRHGGGPDDMRTLPPGGVQVMTAGTGIAHSEGNASGDEPVEFLQIWVRTDAPGHTPRCGQIEPAPGRRNALRPIVVPEGFGGEGVGRIRQAAWFHTLALDQGREVAYRMRLPGNGAYLFVIRGTVEAAGERLGPRDGMGVSGADAFSIRACERADVLIVEVPMTR